MKDFISALMEFSPDKRLTAKEALEHKWIKECAFMENVDIAVTAEAFKNLSKFRVIICGCIILLLNRYDLLEE